MLSRTLIPTALLLVIIPMVSSADSAADRKAAFLKTVDESISGGRLAGNPYKFVGKHVDLHCEVLGINDPDFFNAACGDDQEVPIVVLHSTKSLEAHQSVRVIGIVQPPQSGADESGGSHTYAVIKSVFME